MTKKNKNRVGMLSEYERDQVNNRLAAGLDNSVYVDQHGRQRLKRGTAEAERKITRKFGVIRARGDDPLYNLVTKKSITGGMYEAGVRFRDDFELSQAGGTRGINLQERVDGGKFNADASQSVLDATNRIKRIQPVLGQVGFGIMKMVCFEWKSLRQVQSETGLPRDGLSFSFKVALEQSAVFCNIIRDGERTISIKIN